MTLLPSKFAFAGDENGPRLGTSLLQLGFGLALILALLFATLWLLKKVSSPRSGAARLIRVVSAAAVGPRERVVVVDVAGKRMVLGVAPGQVSLLDEVDSPVESEATIEGAAKNTGPEFSQWLKRTLAKRDGK